MYRKTSVRNKRMKPKNMSFRNQEEPIIFDLNGEKFQILKSNFYKWHHTRLSRLIRASSKKEMLGLCDDFSLNAEGVKTYTFYRNPDHFNTILDLYRTGEVHRLKHSCCMTTREELTFWGVEDLMMELCCNSNYMEERKLNEKINTNTRHWKRQQSSIRISEESYGTSIKDILRKRVWYFLEYSNSSSAAKVRSRN